MADGSDLDQAKLVNLQLEICKETFALLHPNRPHASLTAVVASQPQEPQILSLKARNHSYYACIFATVPSTAGASLLISRGPKSAIRLLCKGAHGVDACEAVKNLPGTLRAELGTRVEDSHALAGEILADDNWRGHIDAADVDDVEIDNVEGIVDGAVDTDISVHIDDDDSNSDTGAIKAPSVASAHDDDDDDDCRSSTSTTRAPSVASSIAPARWPPPTYVEDASTSTDSFTLDHTSGRVPFRGSINQDPIILEVKPPFEQRSFSEALTAREALYGP